MRPFVSLVTWRENAARHVRFSVSELSWTGVGRNALCALFLLVFWFVEGATKTSSQSADKTVCRSQEFSVMNAIWSHFDCNACRTVLSVVCLLCILRSVGFALRMYIPVHFARVCYNHDTHLHILTLRVTTNCRRMTKAAFLAHILVEVNAREVDMLDVPNTLTVPV